MYICVCVCVCVCVCACVHACVRVCMLAYDPPSLNETQVVIRDFELNANDWC